MLQVKDAVKVSLATFAELFPAETFQDLRLEEVKLTDDEQNWSVTVSYKNPDMEDELAVKRAENKNPLAAFTGTSTPSVSTRQFKSINIKAEDGSLTGIKNA